ncbi:hypothetical protein NJB14197_08890 [Mycobacterium montefiorense]|uniref:Uncharacterized protein n=1 Tax=Mycobacterium montefiorense TaxID=154654 RepID=A0AA37PN32_9MYCO|nr:hypothetical protein MmonteBS_12080 [Mycobacterium montefiorense]GKU37743.1 hypothetical protein NJB14191_50890 [Mycobacterium montefiorense]GKU42701.1 hypothetical protein NJB14192_46840 [Mycobacterium montefiorense]GKU46423.1 hypothetical protein NJB14194_30420 [Mycobacterium montefiorense]GKU50994.1 hypothetical protein NJB14195_22400 [Mycobacterium montefiorense]
MFRGRVDAPGRFEAWRRAVAHWRMRRTGGPGIIPLELAGNAVEGVSLLRFSMAPASPRMRGAHESRLSPQRCGDPDLRGEGLMDGAAFGDEQ